MNEIIFLVEEALEGGYIARTLEYSIFVEADTRDELREAAEDAVLCHFEEGKQPRVIHLQFVNGGLVAEEESNASHLA